MMTTLAQELESSMAQLSALVSPLTPEEAQRSSDGWSITEIIEHLAVTERGMNLRLRKALSSPPASSEELAETQGKEPILAARIAVRNAALESPEAVRPQGRYGEWPGPWTAAQEARAQSVQLLEEESERLSTVVFPHPIIGPLHGLQWLRFFCAHMLRHCGQIEAILAAR